MLYVSAVERRACNVEAASGAFGCHRQRYGQLANDRDLVQETQANGDNVQHRCRNFKEDVTKLVEEIADATALFLLQCRIINLAGRHVIDGADCFGRSGSMCRRKRWRLLAFGGGLGQKCSDIGGADLAVISGSGRVAGMPTLCIVEHAV